MFTVEEHYAVRKTINQDLMREAQKERLIRSAGLGPKPIRDVVLDLSCRLPVIKAAPACASQPAS